MTTGLTGFSSFFLISSDFQADIVNTHRYARSSPSPELGFVPNLTVPYKRYLDWGHSVWVIILCALVRPNTAQPVCPNATQPMRFNVVQPLVTQPSCLNCGGLDLSIPSCYLAPIAQPPSLATATQPLIATQPPTA
ncbi:hypothetical protein U1Q18_032127 [Sarracenia purpurea var. burkii]